jgi:alpha-beta hydrolase superfamily lysophospholipase
MLANGIGYVCLDFHGHGYSQGERALVTSVDDLIDDVLSLLKVLYCEDDDQRGGGDVGDSFYADNTPFYFMGQSMGATVAMMVGHMIRNQPDLLKGAVSRLFRGCILMSPAITLDGPNPLVRTILENFLVPCFPSSPVPHFLTPGGSTERLVWKNESFIEYIRMDDATRNKHGLSYYGQIKFQTGSTLLKLGMHMEALIPHINFPFLILHDPRDHISNIVGSRNLMEYSKTPNDRKCCVDIDGGLHDLLSNKLTFVTDRSISWINEQMPKDLSPRFL